MGGFACILVGLGGFLLRFCVWSLFFGVRRGTSLARICRLCLGWFFLLSRFACLSCYLIYVILFKITVLPQVIKRICGNMVINKCGLRMKNSPKIHYSLTAKRTPVLEGAK